MIYLDNSATTKPDESVVRSYTKVATDFFANPSSIHIAGGEVEKLVSESRKQIASLLGIHEKEVFFTSGGTESNNMAIQGIAYAASKTREPYHYVCHRAPIRFGNMPAVRTRRVPSHLFASK